MEVIHTNEKQDQAFILDPVLKSDTFKILDLPLSTLVLMNDSRFPWFILVPRRMKLEKQGQVDPIKEIFELSVEDQWQLFQEISSISKKLSQLYAADKMNIAAIGNKVQQLHIHLIVRKKTDPLWPEAVWGKGSPIPYLSEKVQEMIHHLKIQFMNH